MTRFVVYQVLQELRSGYRLCNYVKKTLSYMIEKTLSYVI